MKWLRNKIQKWIWEWDDDDTVEVGRDGRVLESNYMRIDIYRGEGGLAVETLVYKIGRAHV